ncbi:MAG: M15 family metallopeptidase [bacterium]
MKKRFLQGSLLTIALLITGAMCTAQLTLPSKPNDVPLRWMPLIGEYRSASDTLILLEQGERLWFAWKEGTRKQVEEVGSTYIVSANQWKHSVDTVFFSRSGRTTLGTVTYQGRSYTQIFSLALPVESDHITPLKSIAELKKQAAEALPPVEQGDFLQSDLVEVSALDSTIMLDIRYATSNNFMGTPFYSQAKAFLQRPAAEALVRVHHALKPYGLGVLVFDGYRPWVVTKMFWEATPADKKEFVADPAKGSRHNRGCAVDVSFYQLVTGTPVQMVSGYDEFSHRAYPNYKGGTSLQHWYRDLLKQAMAQEGFTMYESEWWHFDYRDWKRYSIGIKTFEELK